MSEFRTTIVSPVMTSQFCLPKDFESERQKPNIKVGEGLLLKKAQVHYCDHPSSVHLSVCPSLTFHIFDFSSETAERNLTKLDRKQDLNVLYQVCVFRADRKNKMAALASD